MDENKNTELEEVIDQLQQDALQPTEPKMPEVWTVGKHRFFRIPGAEARYPGFKKDEKGNDTKELEEYSDSPLGIALDLFAAGGVKVLGFERFQFWQGGILHTEWKVKTMAPRESETT